MTIIYLAIALAPFIWAYFAIRSGQKGEHRQRDIDTNAGSPV